MLVAVPEVLSAAQTRQCREALLRAHWIDGRATAGHLASEAKRNLQLADSDPVAGQIGNLVREALGRNALFLSAALPLKVLPPRFNRYESGGDYGDHIDSAVFTIPGTAHRVRGDISATLFFNDPDEYDGGELVIEDTFGSRGVKLAAGDMLIYPGTSVHRVTPVTRGTRLASFFWIQSLVRQDDRRALLFNLDSAIRRLAQAVPDDPAIVQLTGVYNNLLRQWSDV